ncbi:MAG: DEAD/DEAH box helicase [Thermoanaerobacterales bacterium]
MDVFELRDALIDTYRQYATSFMRIRDPNIAAQVDAALSEGRLWPHPQIGLNPAFEPGGRIDDLVDEGLLHPQARAIFRVGKSPDDAVGKPMTLHRHQVDAIRAAQRGRSYVLTTGTGSGKSLAYIVPIVDHVLRSGSGKGVKAIVVYPMNALANSQYEELDKFLAHGPWGPDRPVTYARYTGQEDEEAREAILRRPPDILLTNYVMLELILTRYRDRQLVQRFGDLRFLVLDELHTYRGRQGADVALLVRRLREASGSPDLLCVGTSATLSTEGDHHDRQAKVAEIASLIFGTEVRPEDVISETLRRATPDRSVDDPIFVAELTARVRSGDDPPPDVETFLRDPLSIWIESTFGLQPEGDRLVRAVPRPLDGQSGGAALLAEVTKLPVTQCREAIRKQLLAGYRVVHPETGFPVFAFRLHQFLSRGDTVYATPEPPAKRYATLDRQRFVPGDRSRALLPLAFCRACGQDYYVVSRVSTDSGEELQPRDLGDSAGESGATTGFVYLSEERPWPVDAAEAYERLPEEWFDAEGRLRSSRTRDVPRPLRVCPDATVDESAERDDAVLGWWVPTPFRFCLACGVSYAGRLGRDFARLTTLGSEGRSTATTITSLAAVRYLREDDSLPEHARKLLSFTDNRQDASLQAGHFNDFVQVTMLRSALWRAVADGGAAGLTHDEVPQRVFDALDLPFGVYARDTDLKGHARLDTDRVFREVLAYRLYRDLQRGWRLTQPNLEQVGLLRIEYESLPDLAADAEEWGSCHPALADADPEVRESVLRTLLDLIRRDLAIKVDVLDPQYQEGMEKRAQQRLAGSWSLEDERLEYAAQVLPRGRRPGDPERWSYVSARGGFGQYLRRPGVLGTEKLSLEETSTIIEQLFERLRVYGLLEIVGTADDETPRYQLPASAMRWIAGDGTTPFHDPIRMPNPPRGTATTNKFFVDLYQTVGNDLAGIEAREHTAQVPNDERLEREERFRRAELPVLYCSPTMELGVDIAQLNVVNMRNVPPTPANYAQRSGRAGRSGQPALVYTYCAAGSSHDQHFFRKPELMVAGQVQAPRLDLANEDLVRAHVHAVWLAESGLDLGSSMKDVLDLVDGVDDPQLQESVAAHLHDERARARARERARVVLSDLEGTLRQAPWWSESWLDDTLQAIPERFRQALGRWKSLYKAALQQAREQQRIKLSAGRSARDRQQADRLRREAENQLELLRAESDHRNQSDFYTYRYFAAEGFLPGYSFPRLPLSAFIPGRRGRQDEPEFLQRPRFLAISEFGPQSLIYHEGARYRINRVILPVGDMQDEDGTLVTRQAKRCEHCGYLHPIDTPPGPDVCERCGHQLPAPLPNLFRLQNVSTVRRDRITSDEEERQRKGYEVISGVRFAKRNGEPSVREATVTVDGEPLFRLAYGDTTTIWRINLGWRRRKVKERLGFVLDVERGYWSSDNDAEAADEEDPLSKRTQRVIPYVEDSRNALLVTPVADLDLPTMASLEAALKTAFEVAFQLEESELASEPLPSRADRRVLLFYESAEGGAGVLRRLVDEPDLWRRIAHEALDRCHVDPATLHDVVSGDGREPCEAACYDCLLSYRNQPDHQVLDRSLAVPVLGRLRSAGLAPGGARAEELAGAAESPLEAEFLEFLRAGGYRLPDRSHVYFEQAGTRPDFVYDDACAVVYVDGPHHDHADRQARDRAQEEAMHDLGYRVIRFGHRDDWAQIVDTFRSVFGEGDAET